MKDITLGISVYPDLDDIKNIKEYIKLASKYKFKKVFSSMFSVEGNSEEIQDYFKELIDYAHKYNMVVALDVNTMLFEKLGATSKDLKVFSDLGVDILRMDINYGTDEDLLLINNPYGIKIEFNSSFISIVDLIEKGADPNKFIVSHNFYPQRYTGLKWDTFLKTNAEIKKNGPVRIGAFISSNNKNTHGVWDAKDGLVTVERLRDLPIDLQARILIASKNVDDIMIGNAYASESELKDLSMLINESKKVNNDPILKNIIDSAMIDLDRNRLIKIKVNLDKDISDLEKDILLNFYPHISLGDSSEWMWRNRLPRFTYSKSDYKIVPRFYGEKEFQYGDIVIVNDNYKHYAGEIQIVLLPMKNDGQRNYLGSIVESEHMILELVNDLDIIEFF